LSLRLFLPPSWSPPPCFLTFPQVFLGVCTFFYIPPALLARTFAALFFFLFIVLRPLLHGPSFFEGPNPYFFPPLHPPSGWAHPSPPLLPLPHPLPWFFPSSPRPPPPVPFFRVFSVLLTQLPCRTSPTRFPLFYKPWTFPPPPLFIAFAHLFPAPIFCFPPPPCHLVDAFFTSRHARYQSTLRQRNYPATGLSFLTSVIHPSAPIASWLIYRSHLAGA